MNTASNTTINTLNFINLNPASPAYVLREKDEKSQNSYISHTSSGSANIVQEYPKTSLCFMLVLTLFLCSLLIAMYYRPSKNKEKSDFPTMLE